MKNYVGFKRVDGGFLYERFTAENTPTKAEHGDRYAAVIGPYRTKRGALAMVHYGGNNPHLQSIADAERIGLEHAEDLWGKPDSRTVLYA